jgi:hypothetical protein
MVMTNITSITSMTSISGVVLMSGLPFGSARKMLRRRRILSLPVIESANTSPSRASAPALSEAHPFIEAPHRYDISFMLRSKTQIPRRRPGKPCHQPEMSSKSIHKERAAPCGTALLFRPFPVGNENRSYMPEFGP